MTTPTRMEIIAKATEMWRKDQYRQGCERFADLTPEPSELAESGYLASAKSELMRNPETKHAEWLKESETSEFQFDAKEAMQTTCFISGARGVGKSDAAMHIVDRLKNEDVVCIAFDPSRDWVRRSSIIQYFTIKPHSDLQIPETSTIFDTSRLTPNQTQQCVEWFCKKLFEFQLDNSAKRFYLIFEESQIYFPLSALSSKNTQNTMRLLTVGRNFNVSICAISQFPALVSKELVKHSQQLWLGCCAEPNTIQYWRGIVGKYAEKLKDLQNGEFLYYHRNNIRKISIEAYESENSKTEIVIPQSTPARVEPRAHTHDLSTTIARLLIVAIFAALLLKTMMP